MALLNHNGRVANKRTPKTTSSKDVTDFSKVGGLGNHLEILRETIIFPLLHGNVFTHFNIKPPKGLLFHGPPGTGKTLIAKALATEINREGIGKVAFFQRKGADVLDKWVGESEKKLRDLFEKARKSTPAIIFFDELDGLAPVRERQNDQIHCSVVATLLALMDGLDSKPGVIVIGATNRIDAIDPALRRPGRFDRELYFPLPGCEARDEILRVHTSAWTCKPSPRFFSLLVDMTVGFSGADLHALCAEAVLRCMKRSYPNAHSTRIEAESLKIEEKDFLNARLSIVPASVKQGHKMRALSPIIGPLLNRQLKNIVQYIQLLWPHFMEESYKYAVGEGRYAGRVLLVGSNMQGLNTHLVPAILQNFEHLPSFVFDITNVFNGVMSGNVKFSFPAIVVLSRVDEWWNFIDECEQMSIVSTLEEIHAGLPILTVATCNADVPVMLHDFFFNNSSILIKIEDPSEEERQTFLANLFFDEKNLSLYKVWQNSTRLRHLKKMASGDENKKSTRRSRGKAKSDIEKEHNENNEQYTSGIRKRKNDMVTARSPVNKRIRFFESRFGSGCKSYDATNMYDVHYIKKERDHMAGKGKCENVSCLNEQMNKKYFTRVLSDLLSHRDNDGGDQISAELKAMLCKSGMIKIEPESNNSTATTAAAAIAASATNSDDEGMKQIYSLWKHASLVTSKNMTVSQLELLYDVISACINIHWISFETLLENLQNTLENIEMSYEVNVNK